MTAVDTVANLMLVALAGGISYLVGRVLGWSVIFFVLCGQIAFEVGKWTAKKLYQPVVWFKKWRDARHLNRLLEECLNADNRRALRRKADDFLDYPRPRVLPVRVITNLNIQ